MITLKEFAYAKLNLTLDVLTKRPDGYHDLKSVMQTVSFHDDVEIDVGTKQPWSLQCSQSAIPTDERNHAWKAARVFFETVGIDPEGITIRITKRIPSEAGLGGGSADAAAVLRALNRHYCDRFSLPDLANLGAAVGSDVPFCVLGGTAMAEGRGERLRVLPRLPACYIVICKPDFSASTPALYRKLDESDIITRPNNEDMESALVAGDLQRIGRNIFNVFDPLVSLEHTEVEDIKAICKMQGALGQQMTGSGSAVFGLFSSLDNANAAMDLLKQKYPQVFLASPV